MPETVYLTVRYQVEIDIQDESAITRVTEDEDNWRGTYYASLRTREDVLQHLAYNAVFNRRRYANQLDGWADLKPEAATMFIVSEEIEEAEIE